MCVCGQLSSIEHYAVRLTSVDCRSIPAISAEAKEQRLTAKEKQLFGRVRGFLFLDSVFEPTSHKSKLARTGEGDLFEELLRGGTCAASKR